MVERDINTRSISPDFYNFGQKPKDPIEKMDRMMQPIGHSLKKCCGGHSGTRKQYRAKLPQKCNCENLHKEDYKLYKLKCDRKLERLTSEIQSKMK